jgi:AcrR family transcriptional regulator
VTAETARDQTGRRAAHRPSRRDEIISAAVEVFAERGFADASVNDVAERGNVVVSGIYYHFETKAKLFDAATAAVYESLDEAVESARMAHEPGSTDALWAAVHAGNRWAREHPRASKMLYSQLPGATPASARLREEHEARHVAAAHEYIRRSAESGGLPAANSPAGELAARTLIHLMISIMPLQLDGGPLSRRSAKSLEASLQAVGNHIVFG